MSGWGAVSTWEKWKRDNRRMLEMAAKEPMEDALRAERDKMWGQVNGQKMTVNVRRHAGMSGHNGFIAVDGLGKPARDWSFDEISQRMGTENAKLKSHVAQLEALAEAQQARIQELEAQLEAKAAK